VDSEKHVEEEAIRIASCARPTECALLQSEETPIIFEVLVESSSNIVKETEKRDGVWGRKRINRGITRQCN
jgi:hypothetical protein